MAEWRDDGNKKRKATVLARRIVGSVTLQHLSLSLFHSSSLLLVPFLLDLFIGRYTPEAR
jgi:hypothetical protein